MKKLITGLLATLLIVASAVVAVPSSNFSWTEPTNYEDGSVIPTTDVLTYNIYCGSTLGGPYNLVANVGSGTQAANTDVGSCVQGVPGTYYFVATTYSTAMNTESLFSNELSKTYSAVDLGKVPLPPVLISVQ